MARTIIVLRHDACAALARRRAPLCLVTNGTVRCGSRRGGRRGIMSYDEAIFQMYLGEVPMFQACSEEELSAIAYLASPRALEAGTQIVREGESGDDFFVLMMGTATVSRHGHDVGSL